MSRQSTLPLHFGNVVLDLAEVGRLHLVPEELYGLRVPLGGYHQGSEHEVHFQGVLKVTEAFRPRFRELNIDLFLCVAHTRTRSGESGTKDHYTRWITFIDRELAPDFYPSHIWDGHTSSCSVM